MLPAANTSSSAKDRGTRVVLVNFDFQLSVGDLEVGDSVPCLSGCWLCSWCQYLVGSWDQLRLYTVLPLIAQGYMLQHPVMAGIVVLAQSILYCI